MMLVDQSKSKHVPRFVFGRQFCLNHGDDNGYRQKPDLTLVQSIEVLEDVNFHNCERQSFIQAQPTNLELE